MNFDRNQIKEFIGHIEDDIAKFLGFELVIGRLVTNIMRQHALGQIDDAQAAQLIRDVNEMAALVKLGHQYARWARKPPAEVEMMVIADYLKSEEGET